MLLWLFKLEAFKMVSSELYNNELAKETASGLQTLQTLNDLYLLELSQAFAQAIDAGMIEPRTTESSDSKWVFRVEFCPRHQMLLLPVCPLCG